MAICSAWAAIKERGLLIFLTPRMAFWGRCLSRTGRSLHSFIPITTSATTTIATT